MVFLNKIQVYRHEHLYGILTVNHIVAIVSMGIR